MPLVPLKNPLENRPTFDRVCRFLDAEFDDINYSLCNQRIYQSCLSTYGVKPPKVTNRRNRVGYKKKVSLYPVEFIPKMIEIIRRFQKEIKPKRNRIKIAPTPIKYERGSESYNKL